MKEKFDPEKLLFIRPDDDGKSFAGEVIKYGDFVRWFESLQALGNSGISLESKIVVVSHIKSGGNGGCGLFLTR